MVALTTQYVVGRAASASEHKETHSFVEEWWGTA